MELGLRRGTAALAPHDPAWEAAAAQTIRLLKRILGETAADVQHIGSTAVRDIYAKPIIDIAVGTADCEAVLRREAVLAENGFLFRGQDLPGQYLYVCGEQDIRTHHIHVLEYQSEAWCNYINLRDYLNCHAAEAQAYSAHKLALAAQYPDDRGTYTAMKSEMITEILQKARIWRTVQETERRNGSCSVQRADTSRRTR